MIRSGPILSEVSLSVHYLLLGLPTLSSYPIPLFTIRFRAMSSIILSRCFGIEVA
jgi:hypothetical protein